MWLGVARSGPVVRVDEPLASWRRHPEAATTATGHERAAEHLRLFEHGLTLEPQTAEDPELRAEALRNACIAAAWFSRHTDFAPDEPITMLDQDQPLVSAWASGQDPATARFDAQHAERAAAALRSLGLVALDLAQARETDPVLARSPGTYAGAVERLRAVGLLAHPDGSRSRLDAAAVGPALIEAALDCADEVPAERRRYLMPDRRQSELVRDELRMLVGLRLGVSAHGLGVVDAAQHERNRLEQALARA